MAARTAGSPGVSTAGGAAGGEEALEAGLDVRGLLRGADEGEPAQAVVLDEVAGQLTLSVEVGDLDVVEVVQVVALLAGPGEHDDGAAPGDAFEFLGGHGAGHHGEAVDPPGDLGDEALQDRP
ncbi:hypothetical protein ACFQV4_30090 [Streptomyces thermocarboxydus]